MGVSQVPVLGGWVEEAVGSEVQRLTRADGSVGCGAWVAPRIEMGAPTSRWECPKSPSFGVRSRKAVGSEVQRLTRADGSVGCGVWVAPRSKTPAG